MPDLVDPDVRFQRSFLQAMRDFAAEGRGSVDDHSMIGRDLREWDGRWDDPTVFAQYVAWVRAQSLPETPQPDRFVPATTLWWTEDAEYLGRIQLRHELNDILLEAGGHIGYDVPPAHRRRGHATSMLRRMLPICAQDFGLDRVLVTCDTTNVASRKVIQNCGGVLEDQRGDKLRFWVPTH